MCSLSVRLTGERVDVEVARPHEARHAIEDARPVDHQHHQDVAPRLARCPGRPRGWGRRRGMGRRGGEPLALVGGRRSFLGRSPGLDQVGQALARRHHREHVLLLGDLEPDQRRSVDRLRAWIIRVDLAGPASPGTPGRRTPRRASRSPARAGGRSGSCPRR